MELVVYTSVFIKDTVQNDLNYGWIFFCLLSYICEHLFFFLFVTQKLPLLILGTEVYSVCFNISKLFCSCCSSLCELLGVLKKPPSGYWWQIFTERVASNSDKTKKFTVLLLPIFFFFCIISALLNWPLKSYPISSVPYICPCSQRKSKGNNIDEENWSILQCDHPS